MQPTFAIGQRWLSDTESELGLGVVVEVDERSLSILFPQSEEMRVYAQKNAPLSRVVFKVGDWLTDQEGQQHQVASVDEVMGVLRYHIKGQDKPLMETRLAANIQLSKPLERLLAARIENNEWYRLRIEAQLMRTKLATSQLRGLLGARVGLIEHQLYIAYEVGKRLSPRVLLADEVGLGKTIEAGLILHQQLQTGRAERVLILVPDSLQHQWLIELRRKFNLKFSLFDLVRTAAIKEHDEEANPFLTEQLIICSIDLLLDHDDLAMQAKYAGFDMLVVDEAHHLHWSEKDGGDAAYELVEDFARQTDGLLLLTATPEQLGVASHFARLRLLDENRFASLDEFIDAEAGFAEVAQIASVLMSDDALSDKQIAALEKLLDTQLDGINDAVDDEQDGQQAGRDGQNPSRKKALGALLDRHGMSRVLFRNTRETVDGFFGRRCVDYPLPAPVSYQEGEGVKLKDLLWSEEQQVDGGWMADDPRVPWLIELLQGDLKAHKVLLIARSGAVIEALEAALRLHAGIKTAMFTESMSLLERDQAAAYFSDDFGAQILLASEVGSEGRNFQFAHHMVLFDLPANPDTLEQRIGRLDRIGQTQVITIHVPYFADTAMQRIYRWYDEALGIFHQISPTAQTIQEQFMLDLKPALQGRLSAADFEQLLSDAKAMRLELEAELQAGRDKLLEYSSCRPSIAGRIVNAMQQKDADDGLQSFVTRFLSAVNINYIEQHDGSVVVQPADDMLVDGLDLPEEGLTLTFDRNQALVRDDLAYITEEHPLTQSIFEMVQTDGFGNANVAILKSSVIPQGSLLMEAWFRVEVIAPKALNVAASLPQQLIRVLISEKGQDLSQKISPDMLEPSIKRLDKTRARQVIKARKDSITDGFYKAQAIAEQQIGSFSEVASARFAKLLDHEIERLQVLKKVNSSVRSDEIAKLEQHKSQGLEVLQRLSLVPDALRLLVAMPA